MASFYSSDQSATSHIHPQKRDQSAAAIRQLAFEVIPLYPARPEYRQGNTLGNAHRHWFPAKFFQEYRLYLRCHAVSRIKLLGGVNDEDTRRA